MTNETKQSGPRLAVGYIRVSTDKQDRGFSLEGQEKALGIYAAKENIRIVEIYREVMSARYEDRIEFNKMVKRLRNQPKKNEVKIILAEKADRMTRNTFDQWQIEHLIRTCGIEVHYTRDNIIKSRASTPAQKLHDNMQSAFDSYHGDDLSHKVSKGMVTKASDGLHPTKAPFGYMNIPKDNRKIIVPDPTRSHFVKRIFELMASGEHSMLSILKAMTADGLRTKKGKLFSKSHLQALFGNPTYCGMVRYAGKTYPGKHEAIITQNLFDKANIAMKRRTPRWRTERKPQWIYQGLITCGHCGCSVVGEQKTKQSGKSYIYYHCTKNKHKCAEKYLSQEKLTALFREALSKVQLSPKAVAFVRQGLLTGHETQKAHRERSLDALNLRYKELGKLIEEGYVDSVSGFIDKDFYARKRLDWRNEQIEIEGSIANFRRSDDSYIQAGLQILELSKNAVNIYDSLELAKKRELVGFVHSNFSLKDGVLTPTYRKPFDCIVRFAEKENAAPDLLGVESGVSPVWLAD